MATMPTSGIIDADGHVLEPADLWTSYLESRFVDRAIRVERDEAALEYFEIDGAPFERLRPGSLSMLGAMGDETARPNPDRLYMETCPSGCRLVPIAQVSLSDASAPTVSCGLPTFPIPITPQIGAGRCRS
jgi:hypothetical protein